MTQSHFSYSFGVTFKPFSKFRRWEEAKLWVFDSSCFFNPCKIPWPNLSAMPCALHKCIIIKPILSMFHTCATWSVKPWNYYILNHVSYIDAFFHRRNIRWIICCCSIFFIQSYKIPLREPIYLFLRRLFLIRNTKFCQRSLLIISYPGINSLRIYLGGRYFANRKHDSGVFKFWIYYKPYSVNRSWAYLSFSQSFVISRIVMSCRFQ